MLVELVISAYERIEPLKCMLASLMAQTDDDWAANVVIDGDEPKKGVIEVVEQFNTHKIFYSVMDKRYNDFGHTPREIGKQKATADYVILTNDDNYYTPNLVKEIRMSIEQWTRINGGPPGFIYWDMVHSHFNYQYFKCVPATGQIDMGAFATRTDLAKQIKMNTHFAADGDFVEDFKKKFPLERKVKINKVLFVHN